MSYSHQKYSRTILLSFMTATALVSVACGQKKTVSKIDVTDVAHSPVKKQKIGNCWIYATASWAESLHLSTTGETVNISESYWTYLDWYEKLINSSSDKIETGGTWSQASRIIAKYGYMIEGDFAPGEENQEWSDKQAEAEFAVNHELSQGSLMNPASRTPDKVEAVLNTAFGVDIEAVQHKMKAANTLIVGVDAAGQPYGLNSAISGSNTVATWSEFGYPRIYGQGAIASAATTAQRRALMVRVERALNDRKPVIMSTMVDFNALKVTPYATFDVATLNAAGGMGRQGGHMIVLEDYVVDNVPGVGHIGEGDVSPELKAAALQGELVYLKAKNSWGTHRAERGLTDGYTAFNADYLNATLPWKAGEDDENPAHATWYTTLTGFVLPPGY